MFSLGQAEEEGLFNRETEVKAGGEAMHKMDPDLEASNKLGWDLKVGPRFNAGDVAKWVMEGTAA